MRNWFKRIVLVLSVVWLSGVVNFSIANADPLQDLRDQIQELENIGIPTSPEPTDVEECMHCQVKQSPDTVQIPFLNETLVQTDDLSNRARMNQLDDHVPFHEIMRKKRRAARSN